MISISAAFAILATFVIALGASWALLFPFFNRSGAILNEAHDELAELNLKKDQLIGELAELEFDYRANRLAEDSYREEKRLLETETSRVLGGIKAGQKRTPNAARNS